MQVLEGDYSFSADGKYVVPDDSPDFNVYADFIHELPEHETPAVFAMHNNADISFQVRMRPLIHSLHERIGQLLASLPG